MGIEMGERYEFDIQLENAINRLEYYRKLFLSTQIPNKPTQWKMQLLYQMAIAINNLSGIDWAESESDPALSKGEQSEYDQKPI